MTDINKVIYDGKEMSIYEALQEVQKKEKDYEERLTVLEKFMKLTKKVGIYLAIFVGGGLIQNPENLRLLIELLRDTPLQ